MLTSQVSEARRPAAAVRRAKDSLAGVTYGVRVRLVRLELFVVGELYVDGAAAAAEPCRSRSRPPSA